MRAADIAHTKMQIKKRKLAKGSSVFQKRSNTSNDTMRQNDGAKAPAYNSDGVFHLFVNSLPFMFINFTSRSTILLMARLIVNLGLFKNEKMAKVHFFTVLNVRDCLREL
jgi:hypothetical protein